MSIWGVADPGILPVVYAPASNVTLTAGTEVLALTTTSALVGVPGMNYIPVIIGVASFLMGATASAALVIAARFSGGSDFATQTVDTGMLVNSATLAIPVMMVGANVRASSNGNVGTAAIEITGKTTTTACTWRQTATAITILLLPGPDA